MAVRGTDDVDDGVVILLSPMFDLSGLDSAEVAYYRWFSMSEAGTDSGDFFSRRGFRQRRPELGQPGNAGLHPARTRPGRSAASTSTSSDPAHRTRCSSASRPPTARADGSLVEAADRRVPHRPPGLRRHASLLRRADSFDGLAEHGFRSLLRGESSLSWQTATSNCINAEITYNVYRSTTAGVTPGPENLVAAGLTALSITDSLLDPDETYYYVVRAHDSRSGEDSNLVEQSAVATAGPGHLAAAVRRARVPELRGAVQ